MSLHPTSSVEFDFARSVPEFRLRNVSGLGSKAVRVILSDFRIEGRRIVFHATQAAADGDNIRFKPGGRLTDRVRSKSGESFLDFTLEDKVGQARRLRFYHDGQSEPRMALFTEHYYSDITHMFFDGFRLRIAYGEGLRYSRVTTVYLRNPSRLFRIRRGTSTHSSFVLNRVPAKVKWYDVAFRRKSEELRVESTYYPGRLGAEIAYAVAKEYLGLDGIVLVEPFRGGKDLYTKDGRIAVQARMMAHFSPGARNDIGTQVRRQLKSLSDKLMQDFVQSRGYTGVRDTELSWHACRNEGSRPPSEET